MVAWNTPLVKCHVCVTGGWSLKPICTPTSDGKITYEGNGSSTTYVHVNMQKRWLLKLCAPDANARAGALKGSQAWSWVRQAWNVSTWAAVADEHSDSGADDVDEDDPMASLLCAAA